MFLAPFTCFFAETFSTAFAQRLLITENGTNGPAIRVVCPAEPGLSPWYTWPGRVLQRQVLSYPLPASEKGAINTGLAVRCGIIGLY